jgi:hypothetical protein
MKAQALWNYLQGEREEKSIDVFCGVGKWCPDKVNLNKNNNN